MIRNIKSIHCIGVKGIGLSALAQILAARGNRVTGSDVPDPFPADNAMRRAGIRIFRGFKASHVPKQCDLVIASNAYLPKEARIMNNELWKKKRTRNSNLNPEIREALRRNTPIRSYPDVVAELFNSQRGIAVAGSHGKSTTSALLAVTLEALGRNPVAIIGAVVKNWSSNARFLQNNTEPYAEQRRKFFVLEADEYRHAFLNYRPKLAVVTSVDWDHPDIFSTPASYRKAFEAFVKNLAPKGTLIVWGDSPATKSLRKKTRGRRVITYGSGPGNALRLSAIGQTLHGIRFRASLKSRPLGAFQTALYGKTQALNAGAVLAACLALGEKPDHIRRALKIFRGTVRRFDILSPKPYTLNPVIIDDYGHHPTEVAAVIAAARDTFPKQKIRVLFQPHTFSRTKLFLREFAAALRNADEVSILRTYGSARERKKLAGGRSQDLARVLGARHFSTRNAAIAYYKKTFRPADVLLVTGAGDGDRVARAIAKLQKKR